MIAHDDTVTPRQHAAITALLTTKTIAAAAKRAKVGEATLRRWLTYDEAFQRAYRAIRRAMLDGVIGRLQRAGTEAVDALERNLKCGRPGDEIRAALGILDHATRGLELGDLLERVQELERLVTEGASDAASQTAGQAKGTTADDRR